MKTYQAIQLQKWTQAPQRKWETYSFIKIYNAGEMHSNQTGCFPATSSKGNHYIMVLVEVDKNYINTEPMKTNQKVP